MWFQANDLNPFLIAGGEMTAHQRPARIDSEHSEQRHTVYLRGALYFIQLPETMWQLLYSSYGAGRLEITGNYGG